MTGGPDDLFNIKGPSQLLGSRQWKALELFSNCEQH